MSIFPYSETALAWELYEFATDEGELIGCGTLDYCLYRAASRIIEQQWLKTDFLTISTLYEWKQECLLHGFVWCDPKHEYWCIRGSARQRFSPH
jgi:hypothetical protein